MAKQIQITSFFKKSPAPDKSRKQETMPSKVQLWKGNEVGELDVVWARLEGHPFWPAIVCNSPGQHKRGFLRGQKVHVQFFDDPPTRAWVQKRLVRAYGPPSESHVEVCRDPKWVEGVKEADKAVNLSVDDRKSLLVEMLSSDEEMEDNNDDHGSVNMKENVASDSVSPTKDNNNDNEPKAKRRRIVLLSDSDDSEDNYKPDNDEAAMSDDDSASSGVDEALVSGPETESEADSPVKVYASTSDNAAFVNHRGIKKLERRLEAWALDGLARGERPSLASLEDMAQKVLGGGKSDMSWVMGVAQRCGLSTKTEPQQVWTDATVAQQVEELVGQGHYSPQQVFVAQETAVWWGGLPPHGHRLSVLLCFNAAGECRLPPLVVGGQRRPVALSLTVMSMMPVVWRANGRAKITSVLFDEWFMQHFVPAAEKHCHSLGLAPECLLLVPNTPSYPPHLLNLLPHIKMAYLPPLAPWPLHQGLATTLGHYYLHLGLQAVRRSWAQTNLGHVWTKVGLKMALRNTALSWGLIHSVTLNRSWKSLWPTAVKETPCAPEPLAVDIVALAGSLGVTGVTEAVVQQVVEAMGTPGHARRQRASLEDLGLEQPLAGLLAIKPWDLKSILRLLEQAASLAQTLPGGQNLCMALEAATQEYRMLGQQECNPDFEFIAMPIKKEEEFELGEEMATLT